MIEWWKQGVIRQLKARVVRPPRRRGEAYSFTTYMDGTDGIYRLGYSGRGADWGFEAGAFSVVPYYAPMALLGGSYITQMYAYIESTQSRSELVRTVGEHSPAAPAKMFDIGYPLVLVSHDLGRRMASGDRAPLRGVTRSAFETSIRPTLLAPDSWVGSNAYEGGISRQAFLHAAYWHDDVGWQRVFDQHMLDFISRVEGGWPETSEYDQLHQLVFASRYLVLSQQEGRPVPEGLAEYLANRFNLLWIGDGETVISNTGWGEPPFVSYRDWVQWKVNQASKWQ